MFPRGRRARRAASGSRWSARSRRASASAPGLRARHSREQRLARRPRVGPASYSSETSRDSATRTIRRERQTGRARSQAHRADGLRGVRRSHRRARERLFERAVTPPSNARLLRSTFDCRRTASSATPTIRSSSRAFGHGLVAQRSRDRAHDLLEVQQPDVRRADPRVEGAGACPPRNARPSTGIGSIPSTFSTVSQRVVSAGIHQTAIARQLRRTRTAEILRNGHSRPRAPANARSEEDYLRRWPSPRKRLAEIPP
jgi:hypothetical protein